MTAGASEKLMPDLRSLTPKGSNSRAQGKRSAALGKMRNRIPSPEGAAQEAVPLGMVSPDLVEEAP